jgi:deoxyribodipyrimidine photolyase-related protein
MKDLCIIFPHHLFEKHPALSKDRLICFIEDPLFFGDDRYPLSFHKQKIMFHRATMKHFFHSLQNKGYDTLYIDYQASRKDVFCYKQLFKKVKCSSIHVVEFDDFILEKRVQEAAQGLDIPLTLYPSPSFYTDNATFYDIFKGKKHLFFHTFYIEQRKRLAVLVDNKLKPLGGKWSFDTDNRKKAPKGHIFPSNMILHPSHEVSEARDYVLKNFSCNYGHFDNFCYPTTHLQAKKWLDHFLENRLHFFGDYEDAILKEDGILYHSLLSPLLNCGLLTPSEVIEKTLSFAQDHAISLNSLEGFIRQVIGWREFIRGVYHMHGVKQRRSNFFHHKRKMPKSFYTATTGIDPVDASIKKLMNNSYLHHIERLMVLGNFFILCEIHPTDVYTWFMELFIDAYDWVMVPNVYGMSQYADGGLMTTKPYISSSNYLLKMSNYPKGSWCDVWDALFWRFMIKHLSFFEKQPRLQILTNSAKKKVHDKDLLKRADLFLEGLYE